MINIARISPDIVSRTNLKLCAAGAAWRRKNSNSPGSPATSFQEGRRAGIPGRARRAAGKKIPPPPPPPPLRFKRDGGQASLDGREMCFPPFFAAREPAKLRHGSNCE